MKNWFIKTMLIFAAMAAFACFVVYKADPSNLYGWSDSKLMECQLNTAGIIRNYNFDYAIIGSSLIQNMQMSWFKNAGCKAAVKLTVGGMTFGEYLLCMRLMRDCGKKTNMLINLDMHGLAKADKIFIGSDKFPAYQFTKSIFDDYEYFFSYETWFYNIPLNFAVAMWRKLGFKLPTYVKNKTDVEKLGEWLSDYTFGRETVIKTYLDEHRRVSRLKVKSLDEIKKNIDDFMIHLKSLLWSDKEIAFAFPPYSALYWADLASQGMMNRVLEAKVYLIKRLLEISNSYIVDLQAMPEIADLNNYKDSTHYNLEIQKFYADCVINKTCLVTSPNAAQANNAKILLITNEFIKNNQDLFSAKRRQRLN